VFELMEESVLNRNVPSQVLNQMQIDLDDNLLKLFQYKLMQ
jgi:hypothetical protein